MHLSLHFSSTLCYQLFLFFTRSEGQSFVTRHPLCYNFNQYRIFIYGAMELSRQFRHVWICNGTDFDFHVKYFSWAVSAKWRALSIGEMFTWIETTHSHHPLPPPHQYTRLLTYGDIGLLQAWEDRAICVLVRQFFNLLSRRTETSTVSCINWIHFKYLWFILILAY